MNKIYVVRWEDADGEQGYFVRMTPAEAKRVLQFLTAATAKNIIKNPEVDPLEGKKIATARELLEVFTDRYTSLDR